MIKSASIPVISDITKGGKDIYGFLSNLAWLAAPTAAALITLGGVRVLRPEAVAKNADKLILNETLKSSLAQSIRKREAAINNSALSDQANSNKFHDRFI